VRNNELAMDLISTEDKLFHRVMPYYVPCVVMKRRVPGIYYFHAGKLTGYG